MISRRSSAAQAPRWLIRLPLWGAGAWLAYVALQHLLSGRFWLWLLPDLAPPLVYLAVPLVLLAAAPLAGRAWRWCAVLTAAALVLGAGRCGLNLGVASSADGPAPAGAVRVFSWNTEYWHQSDDPDRFYEFLKDQRADVYLLQEYLNWVGGDPRQVDDLARLRREFPGYHIAALGELVTLSRHPIVASPPVGPARTLGPRPPWRAAFDLAKVLRTDLRVGASTLSMYNVHVPTQYMLDENPLTSRFYANLQARNAARKAQFDGLRDDAGANAGPVLVSGDFNSTAAMGDMDWLFDRMESANRAAPYLHPSSWPAGGPALWQLDWTFTSAARVHGYRLVDPLGMSDHRAQALIVSVAERQSEVAPNAAGPAAPAMAAAPAPPRWRWSPLSGPAR
ncbi:endonuclease/exonuclease/phosphatase family protein [Sphaerisporangium dianthi]|uniref:Endonuclease/exonuclease/phosphatase family protein n=1 Tax=Sphaerisporangium dianthi TaxID=1436120 RepID=A0ABV9CRU9_9ACTN